MKLINQCDYQKYLATNSVKEDFDELAKEYPDIVLLENNLHNLQHGAIYDDVYFSVEDTIFEYGRRIQMGENE